MEEKFQSKQRVNIFKKNITVTKATKFYSNSSSFVSPIYTISVAGNIIVYTPFPNRNSEKNFNQNLYKRKTHILAGSKHLCVQFFFHGPCVFHLSSEKLRVQSVRNEHQSGYSRAGTINNNINRISNGFSMKKN